MLRLVGLGLVGLVALALLRKVAALREINDEAQFPDEPDPMAQPFLDSRNSATYLYNAATGVVSSYN